MNNDDNALFDDAPYKNIGEQERATHMLIAHLKEEHQEPNPIFDALSAAMISLAKNIDSQNSKGREISRNMGQYLDALWKIRDLYPVKVEADKDVEAVWNGEGFAD